MRSSIFPTPLALFFLSPLYCSASARGGAVPPARASVPASSLLLGSGESLLGWSESWHMPSPGNSLSISTDVSPWGRPYFNVSFNFTSGVTTTEWLTLDPLFASSLLDAPGASGLSFLVLNPGTSPVQFVATVTDAAGKVHGAYPRVVSGWANVSLAFSSPQWQPPSAPWPWPLPLTQVSLGPVRSSPAGVADAGWLGVADVALQLSAPPPAGAVALPVAFLLSQPAAATGGVLVAGGGEDAPGALPLGALLVNRLPTPCSVSAAVQARGSGGPMADDGGAWVDCARLDGVELRAWEARLLACDVDARTAPPGYALMRAVLSAASCWPSNGTQQAYEGALAVVPPQPPLVPAPGGRSRYAGVFGGQMTLPGAPAAAARIGMRSIRSGGAIWKQAQPQPCWANASCFNWEHYDSEFFGLAEAGLEIMIDARALAPAWAAWRNDSGPTYASIPGPEHYADYQRWLTLMIDRYGGNATAVEVDNEDDGLWGFAPSPLPFNVSVAYSLALVNLTRDAVAASAWAADLDLVGLSTSGFDIKQGWAGGPPYLAYERAIAAAPGVLRALRAASPHPYQQQTWLPWAWADGRNASWLFPNETLPEAGGLTYNSTVAQLLALARVLEEAAAAQGIANYSARLRPSELGYALALPSAVADGWAGMHAAAVAQALLHVRAAPLAALVEKAFLFAAFDGCCAEQNAFYGTWRPAQLRTGPAALAPYTQPRNLPQVMPLPAAAAFAVAAALVDAPAGRQAGVFVVDHTHEGGGPSCLAFESARAGVRALAVLFTIDHDPGARCDANLTLPAAAAADAVLVNGLGTELQLEAMGGAGGDLVLRLHLAALPQYLTLGQGASATEACESLVW